MHVTDLTTFGWDEFFEANFKTYGGSGYSAGRVVLEHKNCFRVYTQSGEVPAEISGKLRHEAVNRSDMPAVGDWVVIRSRPEGGRVTIHLTGDDRLKVQTVREHDDGGRHTTTHRELILLPGGGLVLDTAGMRELQLWDDMRAMRSYRKS
jgi:putative ribosome biogenesis GTPase RsgA